MTLFDNSYMFVYALLVQARLNSDLTSLSQWATINSFKIKIHLFVHYK